MVAPIETAQAATGEDPLATIPVQAISAVGGTQGQEPRPTTEAKILAGHPAAAGAAEEPVTEAAALEELLAAADRALADNRLTRPPVTNAYGLYRHVLLLQADNRHAQAGIARIQQRYAELIDDALIQGNLDKAWRYLRRAEFVGTPEARLQTLEAKINRASAEPSGISPIPQGMSSAQDSARQMDKAGVNRGTIEVSWRSREAASLAQASLLLQSGEIVRATGVLEKLVADYPQAESAALMLFDLYLQTGSAGDALALQAVAQTVPLRHYYQARMLARAGQNDEALTILEQLNPSGAVKQPYLALQAGLYQRHEQYQRAADIYQQLVQMDNRQPTYWLGLGVAAEALGQRNKALQAFIAANQLAPADPAVGQYIERRIQVLSNP
jgi:tetratricopeptide (TPR) repeat protein